MVNLVTIDIVIPVLNEEVALPICVEKLVFFCEQHMGKYKWQIVIADNGSQDETATIAQKLADQFSQVSVTTLSIAGRGRALKKTWIDSEAQLLAYMDVELSTDINVLPKAADSVLHGGHDIVIGSRLLKESRVERRTLVRTITSWSYSFLFRLIFCVSFKDAQCGFKVLTRPVADSIVPVVKDTGWFFDTELLLLSRKLNLQIKQLPVKWIDDPSSSVNILKTAIEDLIGLIRIRINIK